MQDICMLTILIFIRKSNISLLKIFLRFFVYQYFIYFCTIEAFNWRFFFVYNYLIVFLLKKVSFQKSRYVLLELLFLKTQAYMK